MVNCIQNHCTFEIRCQEADSVTLHSDRVGFVPMQLDKYGRCVTKLDLPWGRHRFRYYAQFGPAIIWQGKEEIELQSDQHVDSH